MDNIHLSYGALLLMNKLRANKYILWVWALSLKSYNVPAIVNLLIQRKILKVKGRRSQKTIWPTKRGKNIVIHIVSQKDSLVFKKMHKYRDIEIISALVICVIGFLIMGINRWLLLRKCPAMLIFVLGGINLPCYFFAMTDAKITTFAFKIQKNNRLSYLKNLFHEYHFKWTHNIEKYCTSN